MRDDNQDPRSPERTLPGGPDASAEIESEIRRQRGLTLADAVWRAGAGNLRGASPVPAAHQLVLEAAALLAARLPDADGALTRVLLTRLADDAPLLDRHRGQAASALAEVVDRALATPATLAELVREADARWGRDNEERPRFEVAGRPAAADDPYTLAGVGAALATLRAAL